MTKDTSSTKIKKTRPDNNQDEESNALAKFRVLIVDDYYFMAELIGTMLKELGIGTVMTAESGNRAIDILKFCNADPNSNRVIDIALIDWLMPDGNGVDLLKWIRNHKSDKIRFLPTILISAYASEEVIKTARDNGASEALVKPVSSSVLANRILYVINNPRPFIKAPDFFGPDRRRKEKKINFEDRRKTDDQNIEVHDEQL